MKIDGRPASFDVERSMPVRGRDFRHEAMGAPYPSGKPETCVLEIFAIIEHLNGMQVK